MTEAPRAGYTLPVFACAAAIAALQKLHHPEQAIESVTVDLVTPPGQGAIAVEQVARLDNGSALAITRSDPGDNLDITRHTPIWAWVRTGIAEGDALVIRGGDGIGRHADERPAIYTYARRLLEVNLAPWLTAGQTIEVTFILPEGRSLAERTSNAAFGVVEGLALLGTSGIAQPLSAPEQLAIFQDTLRRQSGADCLVFCIGENGLHLARQQGIPPERLIKTANWLGSMLVEAAGAGVTAILLFGYHGKLLKLAGGIFHTHHYVADGRREILTAHCAQAGLPTADVQQIFACPTAEAALQHLRQLDEASEGVNWVGQIYGAIAQHIDERSQDYIYTHTQQRVTVGSVLFDRDRQIIVASETGRTLLAQVCYTDLNTH
ncbi:MAG: cobalt-precorrin-5B (C(1))-methyltransferase CbiD [Synechococcales bacterium]|nr:cobalt-precorrin-5B (C(1))-methyltransferase CbiD [Synechococcales bacterium]